jgi:hypothetical protein
VRNECKPKRGAGESKKIVTARGHKDNRLLAVAAGFGPTAIMPNAAQIVAEVGKETFEVEINVSLQNGKIISATIDHPVEVLSRECEDAELSHCGPPKRFQSLRRIDVK